MFDLFQLLLCKYAQATKTWSFTNQSLTKMGSFFNTLAKFIDTFQLSQPRMIETSPLKNTRIQAASIEQKKGAAIFPSNQYIFSPYLFGGYENQSIWGGQPILENPPLHFCQLGLVVLYIFVWRESFTYRNSGKWLPNLTDTFHIFFHCPEKLT